MRPILCHIAGLAIPSYDFFVTLALLVAGAWYCWEARRHATYGRYTIELFFAALVGSTLGAKLPILVQYHKQILAHANNLSQLLAGRTVVGGLIGGTLGVIIAKKMLHLSGKTGNLFAPAIALGISIGRIGCLLHGCCYGVPTTLPWGMNFGDGVLRHPTQLYESLGALAIFGGLLALRRRITEDGLLFYIFMIAYFSLRFIVEYVRAEPRPFWGLTVAQVVSLGVIATYLFILRLRRTSKVSAQDTERNGCDGITTTSDAG